LLFRQHRCQEETEPSTQLTGMKKPTVNLIRIGQMAKAAGVSAPTIKHYVNEGLLPTPVKTGKNMAYYDAACVDRIKLIKRLQKEKFLPLDVIKRIIDSGEALDEETRMGSAIMKAHRIPADSETISESRIEKRTGYPLERIRLLEAEGLIMPTLRDGEKAYDAIDVKIIDLMVVRESIGVRFDYSIQTLRAYRDAIRAAVEKDINLFAMDMVGNISNQKAIQMMTEADETLNSFMVLYRHKMLNTLGEAVVKETNQMLNSLQLLVFLPVKGRELPKSPPREPLLKCFYYLCQGDFSAAANAIAKIRLKATDHDSINLSILTDLLSGQLKSDQWKDKNTLLYPEWAKEMLIIQSWIVVGEPDREETYDRVCRFIQHCKKLGIPNPYSLAEIYAADERWKKLHENAVPGLIEFENNKTFIDENKYVKKLMLAQETQQDDGDFMF